MGQGRSIDFIAGTLIVGMFMSLASSPSEAAVRIISSRTVSRPTDPDCARTKTCDLIGVKFVELKKLFQFPNEPARYSSHMTDTRFALQVADPAQLEEYGIVQSIRGCLFESRLVDGRVQKNLTLHRQHFGRTVVFQHRSWEIDSDTTDPLYSADPDDGRFALLRWNRDPASLDPDTASFYAEAKPPHGSAFVTDLPGSGALLPDSGDLVARNTSLEFRTCVFKIGDLPRTTDPSGTGIDPSRALWCATWDHKNIWDFTRRRMTSPTAIDPICEAQ